MGWLNRILNFYYRHFNAVKWARRIGVAVGDNTTISSAVIFPAEPYLIKIGSHVQVTRGVTFYTHGGGNAIRKDLPSFDCFGKIVVSDWAYIGSNSLILPGVTIGEGSIVAAGSVVTRSVAPHTVVAGNPARFICTTEDFLVKNTKYNVNTKGLSYEDKKRLLLSLPEEKFIRK